MKNKFLVLLTLLSFSVQASYINTGSSGGSGGSWGSITGTLSSQTDLQTALDAKTSGSGTTGRHAKWSSSTGLNASLWSEDSSGYLSNNGTLKGLVGGLLWNPALGLGKQSGLFFNSAQFDRFSLVEDGVLALSLGSSPEVFVHGFPNTIVMSHRILGTEYTLAAQGTSAPNSIGFRSVASASESSFYLRDSTGAQQLQITTSPNTGSQPRHFYMSGFGGDATGAQVDFISVSRGGGMSLGGETNLEKLNLLTLKSRPDWTMSGTATASGNTLTGTSTNFLEDVGLGDQVALANAPNTFANVVAIDSSTVLRTDVALSGTGQSIIRRQAPFRVLDRNGGEILKIAPGGSMAVTKSFAAGVYTLTDGASVAIDASLANTFLLSMGGSRTIGPISNATDGQRIVLRIKASGASRTATLTEAISGGFAYGENVKSTDLGATTQDKIDIIGCIYRKPEEKCDVVSIVKGYN